MASKDIDITLIVPCYNESETLDEFFGTVIPILSSTKLSFEILCINDGSSDNTIEILKSYNSKCKNIRVLDFSRNFGKDAAMTAGLDYAKGKCVIPIDCDLQDPPKLILDLINKWNEGFEVVLAKRSDRSSDSFTKRNTAKLFYKIHNLVSELKIPENVGDFRLMDRKVVDVLKTFPERKRFMKGLFAFAGFKTATVEYVRPERKLGKSKWNYSSLLNYAIDGFTSFSTFPLKLSTYCGLIVTALSFARGLWIFFRALFFGIDVPGYASLMVAILFLGGVQLISLGLIGEYVGRIYQESKQRPIYVVREII